MSTTTEQGYAKNVPSFEKLIKRCIGFGASYKPVREDLQVTKLTLAHDQAKVAFDSYKESITNFQNATNQRNTAFEGLRPLLTRVINALSYMKDTEQTVEDVKARKRKIDGKRANPIMPGAVVTDKTAATTASTEPSPKKISVAQLSFDSIVEHFSQIIVTLTAEKRYHPNETDLTVEALENKLAAMQQANSEVMQATTDLLNARQGRDSALFHPDNGLVTLARAVKKYVKSAYGAGTPQHKQLTELRFSSKTTK